MNDERRYRIAVWIVIASEALLFAGLFALYASYRTEYVTAFEAGVREGISWIGTVNTILLLASSFAIAWAIHLVRTDREPGFTPGEQRRRRAARFDREPGFTPGEQRRRTAARFDRLRGAVWSLAAVLALGSGFLVLKAIEWTAHAREGIVPGLAYAGPDHGPGTSLFFTLYYGMTGLHAAHVVAGLALVSWVFRRALRRRFDRDRHLALELVALYWHFVDAVWVFLWPMFYLMHG